MTERRDHPDLPQLLADSMIAADPVLGIYKKQILDLEQQVAREVEEYNRKETERLKHSRVVTLTPFTPPSAMELEMARSRLQQVMSEKMARNIEQADRNVDPFGEPGGKIVGLLILAGVIAALVYFFLR